MRSIVVIVGDVLVQQSPEVALVEHDDLVEQLSAHTAYPTFRNAVLPRAPVALAAQLKSVVLLDDQLVQSDPTRLEWFRQALRTTVRDLEMRTVTGPPFGAEWGNRTYGSRLLRTVMRPSNGGLPLGFVTDR